MPPYPRKLINEGESVVLDLKPHWWFFVRDMLVTSGVFVLFALWIWLGDGFVKTTAKWILVLALLGWAGLVTIDYLRWTYTHFVLTDRRVISRSGIISKRGTEIPLERVNNIDFHQRLIDRVVGAGDLDIESAGRDGQSHFDFVRHPDMVQQEIYRQMEVSAKRQASWSGQAMAQAATPGPIPAAAPPPVIPPAPVPAAPAPAPAPDITEQISKLATLRDQGAITPEEFEAKKAELLDRI